MWLDQYPFIRTLIREALMPRVWTLQKIAAVPSPGATEGAMDASTTIIERSSSSASSVRKTSVTESASASASRRTKSGAEGGLA